MKVLQTSFYGQNGKGIDSSSGTSFASPYFLAKYTNSFIEKSKEYIKDLLDKYNNKDINNIER